MIGARSFSIGKIVPMVFSPMLVVTVLHVMQYNGFDEINHHYQ